MQPALLQLRRKLNVSAPHVCSPLLLLQYTPLSPSSRPSFALLLGGLPSNGGGPEVTQVDRTDTVAEAPTSVNDHFREPAAFVATATLDFVHSRDDGTMAAKLTTPVLSKNQRRRRGTTPGAETDIRLRVTTGEGTVHEVELTLSPPIFRAGATLVHGSDSHDLAALEPPSYTSADGSTAITLGKTSKTTSSSLTCARALSVGPPVNLLFVSLRLCRLFIKSLKRDERGRRTFRHSRDCCRQRWRPDHGYSPARPQHRGHHGLGLA